MQNLSLKLDDSIFKETESLLKKFKVPRNRYINEALAFYNQIQKRKLLEKQLEKESKLVSKESINVLSEFELLEDAY
ncbi:MAG: hypothetical protein HOD63_17320 [Bacteroidetes bacterium]|jgi:hypothetical protein|nr:hypothetical protein [Bacteroidota bacterium]MBT5528673.1 hypothetical protein [Cytophagia bacterium]MBT3422907.1 hypothetical protein [Bacteroidota bacterium]MBT3800279.1 hypothetical protein [Bacteroidota bacterium]MBT3934404.1 hypothetical protein [Bacteroidota bacterium]